ncbi:PAS domain S-box protein [Aerosakkonemataceae cyanobacterium BLCC-F50]|uniref:histidine kinase n=1 Tax=Floridaenema flaviceps BLCC-F50 TaxID=3153642 RepID=A0ABV4XK49_9CYAN
MANIENSLLSKQIDLLNKILAVSIEELTALNQSLQWEIAERQKAKQALQESEMRFHALLDAMFEGIVVQEKGKIINANPGFARMFGYSPEEVIGKSAVDFLTPESLEIVLRHIESQYEQPYEVTGVKKDGTFIDLEVVGKQSLYQGRSVRVSAARDISQRKQAEVALRNQQSQIQRQLAEIETIYNSAPIGLNVLDTELRFVRINQRLADMNGLPVEAHIGRTIRELLPDLADTAERLLRPILETGEPLLNVEITGETPAQPGVQRTWLESFLPLRDGDTPDGKGSERIIGISTVCEEITDRKRAEAELRERERLFSTLADALPVVIFRFDADHKCIYINNYWTQMTGRTVESAMDLGWVETLHPEDRDRLVGAWLEWSQNSQQRGLYQNEGRLVHLNGSAIWYYIQALAEVDANGETVGYIGVFTDITDRKQTEATLQERESLLRLFAQYAPAGIAMFDRDMRYAIASQRWADDYHFGSLELLIGRSHYEIFPEIPQRWRQIHQRCLAGAIETCDEDLFVRADGRQQWTRWEVRPWHTATGEIGGIIIFSEDITVRKQAEASILQLNQELQQKVTELQTLLDVIPIGIGIAEDRECRHIRVNPAFAEVLGIPPTINASLSAPEEERPTNFKVYQNGREMATEELPLQYSAKHGVEVRDLEIEVVWQNGTIVTLLEYAAPLFDEYGQPRGSIGAFLNITERKQALQALRTARDELERQVQERTRELREANEMLQQSEREFRTLVENTPDVITRHDRQYRYLYINPARIRLANFPPEFYLGKKPSELGHPEDLTRSWEASLESVFVTGEMRSDEFTIMIQNEPRSYQVKVVPERDANNSIVSVMTIGRDVTQLKQAEESARKLAEELQRSNQELEQFAYVASHDLQEPLRAITSFTQMLAKRYQGQLDAKADTYIEFIVDGATRMQQLIKDLLAYSRAGRSELKLQSVDFNALLERVKRDLQVAIGENKAIITADSLPTITADPNQMAKLLQNLIGNSLKYRSEAEPRIHIRAKIITVEASRASDQDGFPGLTTPVGEWLFSIQDNGIGIAPQYGDRIFTIFQRLHTSDEYSGTGLGLAICKKIIERHEGRIWVESQLGEGATFFFTIPISKRSQDDNPR